MNQKCERLQLSPALTAICIDLLHDAGEPLPRVLSAAFFALDNVTDMPALCQFFFSARHSHFCKGIDPLDLITICLVHLSGITFPKHTVFITIPAGVKNFMSKNTFYDFFTTSCFVQQKSAHFDLKSVPAFPAASKSLFRSSIYYDVLFNSRRHGNF